jgi:hypothetical protein
MWVLYISPVKLECKYYNLYNFHSASVTENPTNHIILSQLPINSKYVSNATNNCLNENGFAFSTLKIVRSSKFKS